MFTTLRLPEDRQRGDLVWGDSSDDSDRFTISADNNKRRKWSLKS